MIICAILIDDCPFSCEGLRSYLHRGDIEITSTFSSREETLAYLAGNGFAPPEVILLRYDLEGEMTAAQFAIELQRRGCTMPLVVYRAPDDECAELLAAGVVGYVVKRAPLEQVREAVHAARRGEIWVSPAIALGLGFRSQQQLVEGLGLTERERNVLAYLAEGLKNEEIANGLCVAKQTVNNAMSTLYEKFNLSNRIQLMLKARQLTPLLKQLPQTNYTGGG